MTDTLARVGSTLLHRADRVRKGESKATPVDLWRLADTESAGDAKKRVKLYREAMIHAGLLVSRETGKPHKTCPDCGAKLG